MNLYMHLSQIWKTLAIISSDIFCMNFRTLGAPQALETLFIPFYSFQIGFLLPCLQIQCIFPLRSQCYCFWFIFNIIRLWALMLRVQILYHFMWVTVPMSFKFSKPWLAFLSAILHICYAGVSQGLVLKWILKCFFIHFQVFIQLVWSWIGNNGPSMSLSHLKNALYINLISALIGTEIRLILQSDTYEFPSKFY